MQLLSCSLFFLGLSQVLATDLCSISSCNGTQHLGCNNNLIFHGSCLKKRVLVNMQVYEDYLVKIHNKYRDDVASGDIPGLAKATRMPEMLWHWKLALLAEYHVKRCLRNLSKYCVALTNFTTPAVSYGVSWLNVERMPDYNPKIYSEKITMQVDQWMVQVYKLAHFYGYGENLVEIGNILNERNFFLGCAAGEDYDRRNSRFVLICYYDEQYNSQNPLYKPGPFEASQCPRGRSDNYAHLCKPHKDVED
ncbi:uncharacterized protein LOC132791025 [Drosophila nasuta]|uniref:uncharacterized protein LOC132791025 n=1 Tax=Drosophila nasuta TaxID=42062 RepID=UPI00295E3322|nr:uncharacterized protein LOC132791025 [Drosophila nasuta]